MKTPTIIQIVAFCLFSFVAQAQTSIEYKYDAFNRVTESSDGTNTIAFSYDELGNRTQQSISVVLSVEKNSIVGLTLYPNPTPKWVTINANNIIEKVIIYDTAGKQIREQKNTKNTIEIDVSAFSVGIYHFVVFSEGKKQSLKVVKK